MDAAGGRESLRSPHLRQPVYDSVGGCHRRPWFDTRDGGSPHSAGQAEAPGDVERRRPAYLSSLTLSRSGRHLVSLEDTPRNQVMFFTKTYRLRARKLARSCYIHANGDVELAYAMAKDRKSEVGNPLLLLTIGVLVMQGIYYALKVWKEMNLSQPPIEPLPREGFELAAGERYALTNAELKSLICEDLYGED